MSKDDALSIWNYYSGLIYGFGFWSAYVFMVVLPRRLYRDRKK